jgi:phospholipase/carboxylesterase
MTSRNAEDPHVNQPVLHRGGALGSAKAAVILAHGRGALAEDILSLADTFDLPELAYLAPQAAAYAAMGSGTR